jgi:hypothetical protein
MRGCFVVIGFILSFAFPTLAHAQLDSSTPAMTASCAAAFADAVNNGTPLPHCQPESDVSPPAIPGTLKISSDMARAACAIALSGAISSGPPFPKCPAQSYELPSSSYSSILSDVSTAACATALGNAITTGTSFPNCLPENTSSQSISSNDPATLQYLWGQQLDACEGGAGHSATQTAACNARDAYDAELRIAGWCYGQPGDAAYQMSWYLCRSGEGASGGNSQASQQQNLQQQINSTSLTIIPAPIMGCLLRSLNSWALYGTNDVDAIENCNVPPSFLSNAITFMGLRKINGQPVDSPWTDAHCSQLVNAFICEDQGDSVKFSN